MPLGMGGTQMLILFPWGSSAGSQGNAPPGTSPSIPRQRVVLPSGSLLTTPLGFCTPHSLLCCSCPVLEETPWVRSFSGGSHLPFHHGNSHRLPLAGRRSLFPEQLVGELLGPHSHRIFDPYNRLRGRHFYPHPIRLQDE